MPSWNELVDAIQALPEQEHGAWLRTESAKYLRQIAQLRGDRHVILYASAFLQKPQAPAASCAKTRPGADLRKTAYRGRTQSRIR